MFLCTRFSLNIINYQVKGFHRVASEGLVMNNKRSEKNMSDDNLSY